MQHTRQFADRDRRVRHLVHVVAEAERQAEVGEHIAAVEQHDEQLLHAPGLHVVGEQQLPQAGFLAGIAAPEDRDRDQLRIEGFGGDAGFDQARQVGRAHPRFQQRVHVDDARARHRRKIGTGAAGARQHQVLAQAVEHEQIHP